MSLIHTLNFLQVRLDHLTSVGAGLTRVHFVGRFVASKGKPAGVTVNVLFDTGALCANYISEKWYYELRDNNILDDDSIIRQRTCIGLVDNTTKMYSDMMVELPIQLQHSDGTWFTYNGILVVLDTKEYEVIVEVPARLGTLWEFFTARTSKTARNKIKCVNHNSTRYPYPCVHYVRHIG